MLCAPHVLLRTTAKRGVNMDNKLKWMMILNAAMFSFVMAITSPTLHLYFMKLVDPQIYVSAGIAETAIAAVLSSLMSKEKIRIIMRKIFVFVLLLDSFGFAYISLNSIDDVNLRFMGLSILSAVSMTIWFAIMMDMINRKINDVELTNFQTTEHAFRLWGNVAGGVVAIMLVGILKIEYAVWMQCVANGLFAFIDWKAYSALKT